MNELRPPILHLIYSMEANGGAERQLVNLLGALPRLGWDVHLGLAHGAARVASLDERGVTVHTIRRSHKYDPGIVPRIIGLARAIRPALIQTWLPLMDVFGGAAAIAAGVPWILGERSIGFFPSAGWKIAIQMRVRRMLAQRAAAVIANSEGASETWKGFAARIERFVVPNGIDFAAIEASTPVDDARLPRDGRPVVISVGRYERQKNHEAVLAALARLAPARALVGIFCGEGPMQRIEDAAASLGLGDSVIATGYRADVWSWIRAADVFVSASRYEGSPNAVLEAATLGCPLVLSDIPPHREIAGDHALYVRPEDVAGLAGAIAEVLDHPEKAAARAGALQQIVRRWTIPAMASRYDEIYRQLLRR